jgi:CelD/BcsL family acetyltransferase involved in cellulose biosynthesis
MKIDILDPLLDPRWDQLVASHPSASVFHTSGWLNALAKTYGFRPVALTTAGAGEPLSDGVVFCEVRSSFTGARLISLPFSDHAQPLMNMDGDPLELQKWMEAEYVRGRWKYVELRPVAWDLDSDSPLVETESFWVHTLDLSPSLDKIFRNLHKSCFQRRIRHADHEHLTYERSSTAQLVDDFYNLLLITRRRHALLPQPREWFQNIMTELSPNAEIRVARKDGVAIAAILTLRHRGTVVYKYGCTDGRFHRLAGMPFLLWKMIEESKQEGFEQIDLGRTELANNGLIEFKDRMGTTRTKMSYLRYPKSEKASGVQLSRMGGERKLLTFLPGVVSSTMGRLVYKHIA